VRAIDTFRIAAEESVRMYGEFIPLDISERAEGIRRSRDEFRSGPAVSSRHLTFR